MTQSTSQVAGPDPLVSVVITAYNLASLLPKAIESALAQRTTFPMEIIIANNCSEDETGAVADRYRDQRPDLIRVIHRPENIGIQRNYYETFEACRGKYIAWLDADDYWTDPDKLTLQVDLMEGDSTIAISGHVVRWVTRDGEVKRDRYPAVPPGRYGLDAIVRSNILPAPSVVFRNGLHRNLPKWYFDIAPLTDWPLYVVAARTGDIVILDRVMADYILNQNSNLWGRGNLFWYELDARFYEVIETILPRQFHRLARSEKGRRHQEIAYLLRQRGDFVGSRRAAVKAVRSPALLDNFGAKWKALLASLVREAQWRLRLAKPVPDQQNSR